MIKNLRLFMLSMLALVSAAAMAEVTDVLTYESFVSRNNQYSDFSDVKVSSNAVYAGQSAAGNNSIQLRSKNNNSGVVTTASGGKVLSIKVKFNSNTGNERVLSVYGKTTAYTGAADLYGDAAGTLIKDVAFADGVEQTITVEGDYTFIGFRSKDGALYIDEVDVTWDGEAGGSTPEPGSDPVADTLSVAKALEMLASLPANQKTEAQYVKGVISKIDDINTGDYGNATFYISDNGQQEGQFEIYRCYDLGNQKFTSDKAIQVGDVVVVYGQLINYRSSKAADTDPVTPEMTNPCYIVTLNGKTEREPGSVELQTVDNIAAFKALAAGDEATLTLTDAQVVYINTYNGKTDLFVRDATAAIDLYNLGIEANLGQLLNGKINVKLGKNAGFIAAVKGTSELSSTLVATEGSEPQPRDIGLDEAASFYSDFVVLKNVKLNVSGKAVSEDGDALALYDRFSLGEIAKLKSDGTVYDLYGLMYDGGSYGPELVVTKATLAGGAEIVDDPIGLTGDGSQQNPYLVSDLLQLNPEKITDYIAADDNVWVKGFIVGSLNTNASAILEGEAIVASNLALAAEAGETAAVNCIPVQLPAGGIRTALNVKDNAGNVGKEVLIYANVLKYMTKTGLKNPSDFVLDGQQYTTTGIAELKAGKRFEGAIYNLSGQRITTPAKGLFIKNGKKFVLK